VGQQHQRLEEHPGEGVCEARQKGLCKCSSANSADGKTSDLHRLLEQNKTKGHVVQIKTFKEQIMPM
jgi:hypothetical protein